MSGKKGSDRDFNMELLIKEIFARPVLWNSRHNDYANKDLRNQAWEQLCVVYDEEYYNLDNQKKAEICETIRRKYKSLRDSYQRERNLQKFEAKSSEINYKRKKYVYFDQLHFLSEGITRTRRVIKNPRKKDEPSDTDTHDANQVMEQLSGHEEDKPPPKKIHKPDLLTEKAYPIVEISTTDSTNLNTPLPPLSSTPHQPFLNSCEQKQNEEDTLFLLSLVKEIKKIPEHNRLTAKIDILQTIKRWQTSSATNSLPMVHIRQNEFEDSNPTGPCQRNRSHHCLICEKTFSTQSIQKRHLKTHIKNGLFTCSVCNFGYTTINELVSHSKAHKKGPPAASETSDVVDNWILIKDESIENALSEMFNEPEEISVVKCELPYLNGSQEE